MSLITTHVLDITGGRPAGGLAVRLARLDESGDWREVGASRTNDDGRAPDLLEDDDPAPPGTYRIRFETGEWLERQGRPVFYPWVEVIFLRADAREHHHVPLLLSPFGYSTYRGS